MAQGVWKKIEWIREQPEHIRMRYVVGCLVVSMFCVVSIWLLSLKANFRVIVDDVPAISDTGKTLFPNDGIGSSVKDLLEESAPIRVDKQDQKTGTEYFKEQFGLPESPATQDEGAPTTISQ